MIIINETEEILSKLEKIETKSGYKTNYEQAKKMHEDYLTKSAGSTIHSADCWVD